MSASRGKIGQVGQSAEREVMPQGFLVRFQPMELKELGKRKAMNMKLYISSRQVSGQFARKHGGVATGDIDVAGTFGQQRAKSVFETLNVLYFINKQVAFVGIATIEK